MMVHAVRFTEREWEVARLAVEHHSVAAMARDLGIAEKTVKAHLTAIGRKLPGKEPLRRRIFLTLFDGRFTRN